MKERLLKLYRFSNSWTGTVIIVLLVIFFFAQAFVIPSGSMKRTLLIGDYLLVKKFSYGIPIPHIPWIEVPVLPDFNGDGHLFAGAGPQRGDVVVFRFPENPKVHYVKRCVALGGDTVMLREGRFFLRPKGGDEFVRKNYMPEQIVKIQGQLWAKDPYRFVHPGIHNDPMVDRLGIYPEETRNFGPIIVEEGHYFMMGDNRDHSNDSRFWGSVPYKYIVGKPWFIYFSWESRSYDEVTGGGIFGGDYEALQNVCKGMDPYAPLCKETWDSNRFKVRWERIGSGLNGLEELLR